MGAPLVVRASAAGGYSVDGYRPMPLRDVIDFCRSLNGGGEVEIWAEGDEAPREVWSPDGRRIHPAPPAPVPSPTPEPDPAWPPYIRWNRKLMKWEQVG